MRHKHSKKAVNVYFCNTAFTTVFIGSRVIIIPNLDNSLNTLWYGFFNLIGISVVVVATFRGFYGLYFDFSLF